MVTKDRVLRAVRRRHGEERALAVAFRVPDQLDPINDADLLRELGLDPSDVIGIHLPSSHYGGSDPIEIAVWEHDEDTPDNYHPHWRKLTEVPIVGSGKGFDPANKHYRVEADLYPL